jgi:DNA-binding HxlR family transcriptional regulator
MRAYGQYCPIARTAELFAERWTPIIVRNLLNGCRTFTDIRQGAPGIPTALLSQRLDTLERAGIVCREPAPAGRGHTYHLTRKGLELKAVCDAMAHWGARWLEIQPQHVDAAYVLWATTKLVDVEALPDRTVTVRFEMRDQPGESYWLLMHRPQPELCTRGNGYVEDIIARTDSACLIDVHLKRTTYRQAIRSGRLVLSGPPKLTRDFVKWIRPSPYADVAPASAD